MEKKNQLPNLKNTPSQNTKFSNWTAKPSTQHHQLSELDELLLENDDLLKSPDGKKPQVGDGVKGQVATDDSFDIENSDELNKIISKYEMQINNSAKKKQEALTIDEEQIEIEKQLQDDDYNYDDIDMDDEIIDELELAAQKEQEESKRKQLPTLKDQQKKQHVNS